MKESGKNMDTKTIGFFNFKGGVGKTTTTAMVAYTMVTRFKKKVLLIDLDPQANLTEIMFKTIPDEIIPTIEKSLMNCMNDNTDIKEAIVPIIPGLDLIPGQIDFSLYARFLERKFDNDSERIKYLRTIIDKIKRAGDYDYIMLDTPPTLNLANDTAFYACDYIFIVLQTQLLALQGASQLIEYLSDNIVRRYNANLDVLKVLPVLTRKVSKIDHQVIDEAKAVFGDEYVCKYPITAQERYKRFSLTGITDNPKSKHDQRAHEAFLPVTEEIIRAMEEEL